MEFSEQNKRVCFFNLTEGTDVIVHSTDDYAWETKDKRMVPLLTELRVGIEHVCTFVQCICPWWIVYKI